MTITFKVSPETAAKLKAAAAAKRVTKSKYVRDLLEARLKKEKVKLSFYEEMKDIIGCFDGPSDLSTNPKYMKGFGRDQGDYRHRPARRAA
jgi:hypothetical protein